MSAPSVHRRLTLCLLGALTVQAGAIDFDRDIRPLLREHCVECHGAKKQKAELRLDAKTFAFKGGHDGPVIVPGDAAKSPLFERIASTDDDERMPPKGEPLTAEQIAAVKAWIDSGAPWPENDADRAAAVDPRLKHWSVQPVRSDFPRDASIDGFIRAKLAEKGLAMSPEADRRTLIRRATFDLTGLPPTPERVESFVRDPDSHAYEKLVDELLASPHYGERWARHWLDIAHYADTHGFERDQLRPNAWRYRDYVIDSLNADKPYGQFLREQIAGDVIAPHDPQAVVATGFLAAGPWDFVGQVETKSDMLKRAARAGDLDDIVTQVITATMGLTINCARCHDHKLDPITQQEYYGLWAVFAGVKRGEREVDPAESQRRREEKARHEKELAGVNAKIARLSGEGLLFLGDARLRPEQPASSLTEADRAELQRLHSENARLQKAIAAVPAPASVYAVVNEAQPPAVRVQRRGNSEDEGAEAMPSAIAWAKHAPAAFGDHAMPEGQRRRALAEWIVHPTNPLTRRVLVNRLWHHHFGQGLVTTPSDFGLGGDRPSHPELLDWLAAEFLQSGWSLKHMHRLIVTSAAYRQQSSASLQASAIDNGNRLLWRQNPRRLDAESLHDAVLSIAGTLHPAMGGPGFRDFKYTEAYAPIYDYLTPDRPELWRCSIYRFVVRTTPHPFMSTLDCPDPANLTPARAQTTTALQALTLSNSEFMLLQARQLATRLESESTDRASAIRRAFALTFQRDASPAEQRASASLVASQSLFALCRMLINATEFVYLD